MIELEFLTGLGLDGDTAGALLELIGEEQAEANTLALETAKAELAAQNAGLPRVISATPGGEPGYEPGRFTAMGYRERAKLRAENPLLYDKLTRESGR